MMPFRTPIVLAALLAGMPGLAAGQPARPAPARPAAAPAPATAPPPAAVPAVPQQTTASFADWVLRCARVNPPAQVCELVQGIQREDKPVAQIALGHPTKGGALQLTVLVPPSVSFGPAPLLLPGKEGEVPALADLAWRRCVPGGCIADAALSEDALRRLRGWTDTGRIAFLDGAGRTAVLPFSPRGLPQALDALAKEEGN